MSEPPPPRPNNRRLLIGLIVLTLVCIPLAILILCTTALRGNAPPEAPIRQLLEKQVADWNEGNLEAFMTGYWDSDELTFVSGDKVNKGHAAVLDRYRKRYQAEGREMGQLSFSDLVIRVQSSDEATADGRWKVITSRESLQGTFQLTLRKFPQGWKIVRDHTIQTPPSP